MKSCEWTQEYESDMWQTGCGKIFVLNEGTPTENKIHFCCFCGGTLIENLFKDSEDVDE